jgi:hypothetical protein
MKMDNAELISSEEIARMVGSKSTRYAINKLRYNDFPRYAVKETVLPFRCLWKKSDIIEWMATGNFDQSMMNEKPKFDNELCQKMIRNVGRFWIPLQ